MKIIKGKIARAEMHLIYGPDGIGKTSAILSFPKPVIQDMDKGSANLNVDRLPEEKSWEAILTQYDWFIGSEYQTLGIDSIDRLEPIITQYVIDKAGKKTLDDVGAYGKGYVLIMEEWLKFSKAIIAMRDAGKNVVLIGHSEVKTVNDPMTTPYDRHQLKLYHKAASLLRETVDNVFFLNAEVISKEKEKRGFSDGLRYVFTERTPAYDAKNRFGLPSKFELKTNFFEYYKQLKGDGMKPDELRKIIFEKADKLQEVDKEMVIAKVNEVGDDVQKLIRIKTKVEEFA